MRPFRKPGPSILYIGKTNEPKLRHAQHIAEQKPWVVGIGGKGKDAATNVYYVQLPSEAITEAVESFLIGVLNPAFNVRDASDPNLARQRRKKGLGKEGLLTYTFRVIKCWFRSEPISPRR